MSSQLEYLQQASAPVVHELVPAPEPADVFVRLGALPHCLFLDSALQHDELGRYSYVAADPFRFLRVPLGAADPLLALSQALGSLTLSRHQELPSFQGGAAGLLSYDLGRSLERLPKPRCDEFALPLLAVGLYDVVIAFDHLERRAWVISQGWPAEHAQRRDRAEARLRAFLQYLRKPVQPARPANVSPPIDLRRHAPQFSVPGPPGLLSNFSRDSYRRAVESVIEYIYAGDVFQVNLAQRLIHPQKSGSVEFYLRLRKENPAPFAGFFDLGTCQIASASPERFLKVDQGRVEARPIKGTRRRAANPEADLFTGDELRQSAKDRAENVMIVDLMRNDLSRVCLPDSVCVHQLCEVEIYQYVQHLVSSITGQLDARNSPIDLLRASFPGGSITGAPKVRAMEIIAELEPHARGAYCGSLGYVTPDGAMDLSILIRTVTAGRGWWQMPVGGGIVAQSDVAQEYAETWHKAEGLLRAIR